MARSIAERSSRCRPQFQPLAIAVRKRTASKARATKLGFDALPRLRHMAKYLVPLQPARKRNSRKATFNPNDPALDVELVADKFRCRPFGGKARAFDQCAVGGKVTKDDRNFGAVGVNLCAQQHW